VGRLINPENAGKERIRLTRAVVLALRELGRQTAPGAEARDLAAFMALALEAIAATIDASVAAWEKRGYWVKADRFRMDWQWTGTMARKLREALLAGDWGQVAALSAQIAQKLDKVTVPERHRIGRPWQGAWEEFQKQHAGDPNR
jgi:hypothetical protein